MRYQFGGGLASDADTYVKRQADDVLFDALMGGEFCYVLNSRQMGKSSLLNQVQRRLLARGVACAKVDLQLFESNVEELGHWYAGVAEQLINGFGLRRQVSLRNWWHEHNAFGPVQRLEKLLREVILTKIADHPVVILIDEIDSVLGVPFDLDDFFRMLRACAQKDGAQEYQRLTFGLFGVATPASLIRGRISTPFNIGKAIPLEGFSFEEARGLAAGLAEQAVQPEVVLREILAWTAGQPFLTQKLCALVQRAEGERIAVGSEAAWMERLVREQVIENWEKQDQPVHLKTIQERLLQQGEKLAGRVLGIYRQVCEQGYVLAGEFPEEDRAELHLSGLLVEREVLGERSDVRFEVKNRIYREVFDAGWIERCLRGLRDPFYAEAFEAWVRSGREDESVLLRGQALREAQAWAKDRRLSSDDESFLAASQKLETRDLEQNLEAATEAQQRAEQILGEARREAEQERQEAARVTRGANRRFWMSAIAAVAALAIAGISVPGMLNAQQKASEAQAEAQVSENAQKFAEAARRQEEKNVKRLKQEQEGLKTDNEEFREKLNNSELLLQRAVKNRKVAEQQQAEVMLQAEIAQEQRAEAEQQVRVASAEVQAAKRNQQRAEVSARQFEEVFHQLEIKTNQAEKRLEIAQGKTQIAEKTAKTAIYQAREAKIIAMTASIVGDSQQAEFDYESGQQLLGLVKGIRSADRYKKLEDKIRSIDGQGNDISNKLKQEILDSKNAALSALMGVHNIREKNILRGHQGMVGIVKFSPDGRTIASAGEDGVLRLWNKDGNLEKVLEGHRGWVYSMSFSPDSKNIVSTSKDGSVRLWNKDGNLKKVLGYHQGIVGFVNFSIDGKTIVSADDNGTIKIWSKDGYLRRTIKAHHNLVRSIKFSPDGNTIISIGEDGMMKIWSNNGHLKRAIKGHQDLIIMSADFSPDGKTIVSAGEDGKVKLWSRDGTLKRALEGHQGMVGLVKFSPDGKTIVSAGEDGTVRLWGRDGKLRRILEAQSISVNFSPDGKTIASAGKDGTVRLWSKDGTTQGVLKGHQGWARSVNFSPDGKTIVSAGEDGTVRLWKRDSPSRRKLASHQGRATSVNFSPDGKTIVSAGEDGMVRLWGRDGTQQKIFEAYQGRLWSVNFSPDGKTIVSAGEDGTIRLWSRDGTSKKRLRAHNGWVWSVNFSPDGKTIVSAGEDGKVKLWSRNGSLQKTLEVSPGWFTNVNFSRDGKTIIAASEDRTVWLWTRDSAAEDGTVKRWLRSGTPIGWTRGEQGWFGSVNLSPDGQSLISTGDDKDGTVRLWSRDGNLQRVLKGHQGRLWSVNFSPDGKTIVSAGKDGTVRLWSRDGSLQRVLEGHQGWVGFVNFSPDGKTIVSAGEDGTVRLWSRDFDQLLNEACDWANDYLRTNPNVTDEDRALCGIPPKQ